MRVSEENIEGVRGEVGEVIRGQLFQSIGKTGRIVGGQGSEIIRLFLIPPRQDVHGDREQQLNRSIQQAEEDETGDRAQKKETKKTKKEIKVHDLKPAKDAKGGGGKGFHTGGDGGLTNH